ncbi:MAG: glycosyltransferase [Solirubrobacteraceae bacterium]
MIPHILHQIWVGPNPLPEEYERYAHTWVAHHPRWEVRLWSENNLPTDLVRKEALERLRVPAERSDILRLELLWRFGGVYVDTDLRCLRSIEPLIAGVDFFAAYLKPGRVCNGVLGSVPGHRILERAVQELQPRTEYGFDKGAAGSVFVQRLLRDYPEATVYPASYFFPDSPEEEARAYAIHTAGRSWSDPWRFVMPADTTLGRAEGRISRAEAALDGWGDHQREIRGDLVAAQAELAELRGASALQLRARSWVPEPLRRWRRRASGVIRSRLSG